MVFNRLERFTVSSNPRLCRRMCDFTKAAEEKNAENLLIIRSKELAGIYIENWYKHKQRSEGYLSRYEDMNPDENKYYSMEFIDEDDKLFVLVYNDKDELVVRRELPKDMTVERFTRSSLLRGDN